ncbi:MAG: M23 family peptidase, partial [Flavobacteriales bacterium]|nr:M23 family peptidase [Flavobacteriales bacterium]
MQRWKIWTVGSAVVLCAATVALTVDLGPRQEYVAEVEPTGTIDSLPLPPSEYGIPMAGFVLEQAVVKPGATFGDMLTARGVSMSAVHFLVEIAEPFFDVRRMRSGHPCAFIFQEDSAHVPSFFVYEADPVEYIVFALKDQLSVRVGHRPVEVTEHSIACKVTGALYNDLANAGADPMLAMQLADVFAWTIDFYRIQKDDVFSVVYSERTVDGERYGRPRILAARYTSNGRVKEAFDFAQADGARQYFDQDGNSLRKAFLKAPLKFSRISSGFSNRRFHPVQKVMKA